MTQVLELTKKTVQGGHHEGRNGGWTPRGADDTTKIGSTKRDLENSEKDDT